MQAEIADEVQFMEEFSYVLDAELRPAFWMLRGGPMKLYAKEQGD